MPTLVPIYQVLQSKSYMYMIMPKVKSDLYAMLRKHDSTGGITEDTALNILSPVIDAVCYLHKAGFAHRDIKSENIMLNYDLNVDDPQRPVVNQLYLIGNHAGLSIKMLYDVYSGDLHIYHDPSIRF